MAKKTKDEFDGLDDLDSILKSLEGDDLSLEEPKSGREAVEGVLKDGTEGFIDHFKQEPLEKVKKFINDATPRGIRDEADFIKGTLNSIKDVYEKDAKEIKSSTKATLDIIKSKMPDNSGIKNILNKISDKLGVDDDGPRYSGPSQDEIISETLDNLFKRQEASQTTREIVSEIKDNHKFETEISLTNKIVANLEAKNEFDRNYTINYYRKSIELKMKTMLISKELLETTKMGYDTFKTQFEAIIKNTSLPDLIKLRNTEQTKEAFSQRVRENLVDMFFTAATPLENMKQNIIKKAQEVVGNVSMGLNAGLMGAETANGVFGGDMSQYVSKSNLAGGQLGEWVSNFASEVASRKLEDNDTIRDKLRKLKLTLADPRDSFYELADDELEKNTLFSRMKARVLRGLGGLAQTSENNMLRIRENAPDDITYFDYRTKNSIVKIIPMILSKIYGEVKSLRTGEDPSGVYYDYTSGKLEDNIKIKDRFKNNIKAALSGVAGSNLNTIIDMLDNDEENKLDDETKNNLKSALLGYLAKDGSISPAGLGKESFLKSLSEKDREAFLSRYETLMDKSKKEIRILDNIKDSLYGIKTNIPFVDKLVNDMYKNGNIEEIMKMGILNYDDKEGIYTVNKDKYVGLLDDSIKELNKENTFNTQTSENIKNDGTEDSMSKIFEDAKKQAYDDLNKKYNLEARAKLSKRKFKKFKDKYNVDEKIDSLEETVNGTIDTLANTDYKDLASNITDADKRNKLTKRLKTIGKYKSKRIYKKLDIEGKLKVLEDNAEKLGEMTPEDIKDYIVGSYSSIEDFIKDKHKQKELLGSIIKKSTETLDKAKETELYRDAEKNINAFIKKHKLKERGNRVKNNILSNINTLDEKYKVIEKTGALKTYIEDKYKDVLKNIPEEDKKRILDEIVKGKDFSLEKLDDLKSFTSSKLKSFGIGSDIDNVNKLKPNEFKKVDFGNYQFKDTIKFRKLRNTKLKDLLSLDKVDPEVLYEEYKKSDEFIQGIDFLTYARNLGLKHINGTFIRIPEDLRMNNIKNNVMNYLERQSQGMFSKEKFGMFKGIKSIFGVEPGMTPMQILSKVLKKTRAWDRKIMFDIVPKAMGKVFKFPFKLMKGGAKAIYKGVFNRNTMNFARVLAGLDPVYPDGEKGSMSTLKDGLDKTRELDKKILKSTPGILGKILKTPFDLFGLGKKGIGKGYNWFTGKEDPKEKIKEAQQKVFGDEDGDGDIDGSWRDRRQEKPKDKKDGDTPIINIPKDKKDNGILGLLASAFGFMLPILKKIYSGISGTYGVIKGLFTKLGPVAGILKKGLGKLTGLFSGLLGKLGIGAGLAKLAEADMDDMHLKNKNIDIEKDKMKVDIDKNKPNIKVDKPDKNKIMAMLRSFKDKIVSKLGKIASVKVVGTLMSKIASRLVPFAGIALLAYDASMIAKLMISDGLSFRSAVSKHILGYDLFNDDEPILDEDGNPVKPDEISSEEFVRNELIDEYIEKSKDKDKAEEAEKFRQEYGLDMEEIAKRTQVNKDRMAYESSGEYGQAYKKALDTKNYIDKSGKSLAETYGKDLDMAGGTFNIVKGKEAIGKLLDDVADKVGVEKNMFKAFAAVESDMNPLAKAGSSSASGLFQFINSTWQEMLSKYGDKYGIPKGTTQFDPMANALMGAEYIKQNEKYLSSVKPKLDVVDHYLAHFLGPGGAKAFLSANPNSLGVDAVGVKAALANKTIFYKNGGSIPRTVSEVYELLKGRISEKAKKYGFVAGTSQPLTENKDNKVEPLVGPNDSSGNVVVKNNETTSEVISNNTFTGTKDPTGNVEKVSGNNTDITGGIIPKTQAITTSQPEVDFSKKDDILNKSYLVQSSMDTTLKSILTIVQNMSNGKVITETNVEEEKIQLETPEPVVDLGKKRY